VRETEHELLYLEYAEEQNHAKHHHEQLSADDGEIGDLDSCKEQKQSISERNIASTYLLTYLLTYSLHTAQSFLRS
jgi:hypothetical protein